MDNAAPIVSIIMATYNWSSVLRCGIESALGQTFGDFELLVMGDGCTDDSAEVAASFRDTRVRWQNLPVNSGNQSAPNNAGLEMAQGKYVAYHGHDDVWHPTHLANLVKAMEAEDVDLAHSIAVMIGPPDSGIRIVTGIAPHPPTGKYVPEMFVPPTSVMHRRDVVAKTGGWRDYRTLRIPPDREFTLRIWEHRKKFASVPELTAFKFNASWRRNSYKEKPCHEQREYLRRMKSEPDFVAREMLAITTAYVQGKIRGPVNLKVPRGAPPGWLVEQWRQVRGLEPGLPAAGKEAKGLRKFLKGFKRKPGGA